METLVPGATAQSRRALYSLEKPIEWKQDAIINLKHCFAPSLLARETN